MKPPVIRLIDLGLDDGFSASMSFAQGLINSINVSGQRAEVEYLRTTDRDLVAHALTVPARLIHIMAHGSNGPDAADIAFGSVDDNGDFVEERTIRLANLAEHLHRKGEGIEATAVFADCCSSAQARVTKVLRDSLETDIVYIGSTRAVDWHEATTFDSILYGSMLRKKGAGFDAAEWVFDAAEKSIDAYEAAVNGRCPFKVMTLTPSAKAAKKFAKARPGQGIQ